MNLKYKMSLTWKIREITDKHNVNPKKLAKLK